jgi:hypothetical protein
MFSVWSSWSERSEKRRRELAEGADADLVRANRNRYRAGFGLIIVAVVLGFLKTLSSSYTVRMLLIWAAGAFLLIGVVIARWAMLEDTFLNKPDREGPPKLFDD